MPGPCYPADLKKFDLTHDEAVDIWKYARDNYVGNGRPLADMIHSVASDLGLRPEWVAKAFVEPKQLRPMTNEVYRKGADRRAAVRYAKEMVRSIDTPLYKKAINAVLKAPFAVAVYGHGTVGMITHAGGRMFLPSQWNTYWPHFFEQWKLWLRKDYHEAVIQNLVRDPQFTMWQRAGAAIDPAQTYTDYGMYAKWLGRAGQAGSRGFDALKLYRLEANKAEWAKVPEAIKRDPIARAQMAKNIAQMTNHATGVADIGYGAMATGAQRLLFAAKLEASRWARIIGDPIKTVDTFANWKNAAAADRQIAMTRVKHAAEFAGFYIASMLANQGLLMALGSKQNVNFTDPTQSDWLKFKAFGRSFALDGNLLAPLRLLGKVIYGDLIAQRTKTNQSRFQAAAGDVAQYVRGKLSPLAAIATDVTTSADYSGRPMPWSSEPPKYPDQPRYTASEYALSKGPIPLSGAIREIYDSFRAKGMGAMQATTFIKALATLGIETTGAKVSQDYAAAKPKTAVNTVHVLAKSFREKLAESDPKLRAEMDRARQQVFAQGDYTNLNNALVEKDNDRAGAAIQDLLTRKGKTRDQLVEYYSNLPERPFSGSEDLEDVFLHRLSPPQRAQYRAARNEQIGMTQRFFQVLRTVKTN